MSGTGRTRPIRRRDFAELPPSLVAEVERRLGPVRGFEERRGGFSDGVLGVAALAGGERVFVKAVPADGGDAGAYREEAAVSAALPPGVPAPRMRGRCELWQDPGPARLGAWERDHLARLAEIEREWESLVTGDTMLHFDPRFDNILIDGRGTARLVALLGYWTRTRCSPGRRTRRTCGSGASTPAAPPSPGSAPAGPEGHAYQPGTSRACASCAVRV
ncbi:hypothetical protein [Nonomuraea sp. JJY05]|uniref:hypothetical protein n=1 Tax=Nonomuraea sp. JJY05 TaxID=3350255 RepID=UPI00373FC02E